MDIKKKINKEQMRFVGKTLGVTKKASKDRMRKVFGKSNQDLREIKNKKRK